MFNLREMLMARHIGHRRGCYKYSCLLGQKKALRQLLISARLRHYRIAGLCLKSDTGPPPDSPWLH